MLAVTGWTCAHPLMSGSLVPSLGPHELQGSVPAVVGGALYRLSHTGWTSNVSFSGIQKVGAGGAFAAG